VVVPARAVFQEDDLILLEGREAILPCAALLQALAERCDQQGAMHWLEYFLSERYTRRKHPYLVLKVRRRITDGEISVDDVTAAALLFEYRILGWRTRAFSTDDAVGFRTVIAPPQQRAEMAERSAKVLIQHGAHIVLVTYEASSRRHHAQNKPEAFRDLRVGTRSRSIGRIFHVEDTFDATLARMGKSTRFNLRYYRRRLVKREPCIFVEDARAALSVEELRPLNQYSLNPVPWPEFELRWRCGSELPGSFVVGLRTEQGRWLSLIGGWRQGSTTVVYWQLNTSGFERDSIGTVMRSFFLEHEVQRHTRKLLIFGGTPHTLRYAFEQDTIADLLVCRPSQRAALLRHLAWAFSSELSLTGRRNFLAETLRTLEFDDTRSGSEREPAGSAVRPAHDVAL
jgi:hypothetical protein